MVFTYTYRTKGGATAVDTVEAVDRSAAFSQLKARGVAVLKFEQGVCSKGRTSGQFLKRSVFVVVFGLLVAVVGVSVWLCLKPGLMTPEKPDQVSVKSKKQAQIAVRRGVETNVFATSVPVAVEPKKPEELPPQKVGETRDGYIKLPSGRLHKVRGVVTNSVTATQFKGKYEIFDHHTDNEIACLLSIVPGQGLVGTPRYNGKFKKQFLESLKEPILINEDDSDEDKNLKRNVIAVREQLKAALDRGEDIEEIMLGTRKEYQNLAIYKQQLKGLIYDFQKGENVTDQDVEDYVQAANKMLEEKGIAPMNIGPITRQKIRMEKMEERKQQLKRSTNQ